MLKAQYLFVAVFSMISMVFQPVAYGQAQENWAAQALKEYVKQNQKAGKQITVKEFWEKNKAKLHPDWQNKFYPAIDTQRDEKLPQMEVITVKGPGGRDTARLMITLANQKTISVEFLGGQEKYARINNQTISYNDFYYGDGLIEKLSQEPVIKAEAEKLKTKALKSSMVPSYQLFMKMTAIQRADYFINMRVVLQAAAHVNNRAFEASTKSKEAASFMNFIINQAYAAGNVPKSWVGKRCIVAGYVGNYTEDKEGKTKGDIYCDSTEAIKNFAAMNAMHGMTPNNTSKSVYDGSCGAGNLRCNPFVYGFDRGNGSTCVKIDRQAASFQQASRTCDNASPLRKESLAADTEAMVKTLLGKENKAAEEYFKDGKVVSEEKYNELMNTVVKDFNTFIDEAIGTCSDSKNLDGTTNFGEKYQADACGVLKARKLAFMEGFAKLKGVYEKPTPTPAPPVTQPPIADEGQCKTPDGKPGFYDSKCQCKEPGTGEAGVTGAPKIDGKNCTPAPPVVIKDGDDCDVPGTNPPARGKMKAGKCEPIIPPPVVVNDECVGRPMAKPDRAVASDGPGKAGCAPRAAELNKDKVESGKKAKKKKDGFDCDIVCPLLVLGLFGYAAYASTKSHQTNRPGTYIPPVPPPLPAPPPQPTPVVPVPPIVPTLPIPNPAGGETPIGAPVSPTTGVGTR